MVEIGGKPILWHIMKIYDHFGFTDFVIACGYKAEVIKQYFSNLHLLQNDLTFDLRSGECRVLSNHRLNWRVTCIDTGVSTFTAGRLQALEPVLQSHPFMLTYGDGVANVDIKRLLDFHKSHGKLATVTAVRPKARFGLLTMDGNQVVKFAEKSQLNEGWINGGFFVFEPGFFQFIARDEPLEQNPLVRASEAGELMAYYHDDFWQPMDTLREKNHLEELWAQNKAPWKLWEHTRRAELV